MHYLTQTVYSMAGYRTLQDIVSGYFAHRHWYCGEDRDDDLRSWPLAERWKDERDSCYVSAIPMRSWYSLIGHGVGVRIINDKRRYQERGIFASPSDLRRLFPGVPNRIEVDGHHKLTGDADFIARDLALAIDKSRQGGRIIRIDVDNEATRLKTNPLLAEDERFGLLTRRSMDYLPPTAGPELLKMQLQRTLGSVWQSVTPTARRFLISGLVYYEECDAMGRMLLDASPGIISLTKALELEVNHRLLRPFRQWLASRGVTATSTGPLKPFASAVASPSGTIELGRMGFALRSLTENEGYSGTHDVMRSLSNPAACHHNKNGLFMKGFSYHTQSAEQAITCIISPGSTAKKSSTCASGSTPRDKRQEARIGRHVSGFSNRWWPR